MKWILFILVIYVLVLFICTEARGGAGNKKPKAGKVRNGQGQDCSEWTFSECMPQGGATCGKGSKNGVRTGDNCSVKEKSFPCKVPCAKNKCKYQKGEWSECDLNTNTMTRTNTLKKGDTTTCQASKVITKKCKNKKANTRQNPNRRNRKPAPGVD